MKKVKTFPTNSTLVFNELHKEFSMTGFEGLSFLFGGSGLLDHFFVDDEGKASLHLRSYWEGDEKKAGIVWNTYSGHVVKMQFQAIGSIMELVSYEHGEDDSENFYSSLNEAIDRACIQQLKYHIEVGTVWLC